MKKNFGPGQSCEAVSGKATSLRQSEARRAGRRGTRYRSTLDEAPEVHTLAEKSGITFRQGRELLNRYQGDQAAIDDHIAFLKRAAMGLE
jgi:hypothetical protein